MPVAKGDERPLMSEARNNPSPATKCKGNNFLDYLDGTLKKLFLFIINKLSHFEINRFVVFLIQFFADFGLNKNENN